MDNTGFAAVPPAGSRRPDRGKRLLDVAGAVVGLLVTAPVMALVALVVLVGMGRPVLFRQTRPGRDGRPFELVKFRSMALRDPRTGAVPAERAGALAASDADRLTPLGRWLRATSLDELPTLWNVLRGEMSLVGPRPLRMLYLQRYSPRQARRHEVRPGITGLAQVRGRNALTWEEKFDLDVAYVDQRSLALDLRILAETVLAIVRRTGISAQDSPTMPEFTGTAGRSAPATPVGSGLAR
jgi:lipopolysaccharide/colanic/teichoic acid biosynthesis glycosyltransferase